MLVKLLLRYDFIHVTGYVRISMVGVQVASLAVGTVCTKFVCTQFLSLVNDYESTEN